jgi:hypothetical protein
LYTTALRSVAIIIARNGSSTRARSAATGALKETGKLILIISLHELCQMFNARDSGQDATAMMYSQLYALLSGMSR